MKWHNKPSPTFSQILKRHLNFSISKTNRRIAARSHGNVLQDSLSMVPIHKGVPVPLNHTIECHGSTCVLKGVMGLPILLNHDPQMLSGQVPQAARSKQTIIPQLHETLVEWCISSVIPRNGDAKHLQIIFQSMSDQNFVHQELLDFGSHVFKVSCCRRRQVLFSDAWHKGSVVSDWFVDFYISI